MKTSLVAISRFWKQTAVIGSVLLLSGSVQALDIIDPTGAIYTGVTNSSQFAAAWGATNLFTQNMSSIAVGQTFGGAEWAKSGPGSAYVAFQVDQVYSVGSIFWAQRNGSTTGDNMQLMSIWASDTTPFAAEDPGTPPDNVIPLEANIGASVWSEYILTNTVSGRYFLMYLQQTPGNITGNPGGNEMRLGLNPPPTAPTVMQSPASKTVFSGGSVSFEVSAAGSVPMTFQWYRGGTKLEDDARISGATSSRLKISQLAAGDVGDYYAAITNAFGGVESASASLALTAAPTTGYPAAVMSNPPAAYWQLDETSGSTAFDYAGGHNGTYEPLSTPAAEGPRPPDQPGFSSGNTAVQTTGFIVDSAVTLPPLNFSTNNLITILAWIKPDGDQQPYTGIVFSRSAGTIAGISYDVTGTNLAYEWAGNRVSFDSGIKLPQDQWSMVALVITPTNATLYCGNNQSIRVATDTFNEPIQTFSGETKIGLDVSAGESARTFNGTIDEVAIYDGALSEADITALYAAGVGIIVPLPVEIATGPTDQSLFTGEPLKLSAKVTGSSPIAYQWYKDDMAIPTETNASFAISTVRPGDAGGYYLIAANSANSVTSTVAQVTVSTNVLRVLDPKGMVYTNVLASSVFGNSPQWGPSNLFTTDVSGLAPGAVMTTEGAGKEWARSGSGDAWISFEVDQVYPIGAFYWSQRVGSGTGDNMQIMSIWSSDTTPFDAADPGSAPSEVISLNPNSGNPVWTRYLLTSQISGRYFLLHLEQTTKTGNPGGSEMRLGVIGYPAPLSLSVASGNPVLSWPAFGILEQADSVTGPWITATSVTNGAPLNPTADRKFYRVKYY